MYVPEVCAASRFVSNHSASLRVHPRIWPSQISLVSSDEFCAKRTRFCRPEGGSVSTITLDHFLGDFTLIPPVHVFFVSRLQRAPQCPQIGRLERDLPILAYPHLRQYKSLKS